MFWKLTRITDEADFPAAAAQRVDGRFVLHRHRDALGPHLDLRLEQEGYLAGWRIEGLALAEECWATEKMPHPLAWLTQDGEAIRAEDGEYAWRERGADGGVLELRGRAGVTFYRVERAPGLPAYCMRSVAEALEAEQAAPEVAAALIHDGMAARKRAIERFCGLGRELDGTSFNESLWRKTLSGLSLREISAYLDSLEVRFDRAYPPQAVSRPEPLPAWQAAPGMDRAFEILAG